VRERFSTIPAGTKGGTTVTPATHCEVCHIGTRRPRRTTVTYWLGGELVLMPNVPVGVCDVCGDVEYEAESIARLEMLLGIEELLAATDHHAGPSDPAEGFSSLWTTKRRSV
jgi:YgiT-type zinc finger domain-containing protein